MVISIVECDKHRWLVLTKCVLVVVGLYGAVDDWFGLMYLWATVGSVTIGNEANCVSWH